MVKLRNATALMLLLFANLLPAQQKKPSVMEITSAPLGDAPEGVVMRITFRSEVSADVPNGTPLALQGSILQQGKVLRNFRHLLVPGAGATYTMVQTLPLGEVDIDARLLIPLEESAPLLLGKGALKVTVGKTGTPYIASEDATADAIIAEGALIETAGAVRISPPRRDLAPNLFIVDVAVKPPVKKVEFYVEGKKIFAKNAPPYRAELDLGLLPRRVEIRVVGYDAVGRYVDADAWLVNERDNQLELKITRTITPDKISHVKISIQNPKNSELKNIVLFAGDRKLVEFKAPPYAVRLDESKLKGVEFLRASATDSTGYEASDLLFLDGSRYIEEVEVNMIELPVGVTDQAGVPLVGLKQEEFEVFEDKKPKKIANFAFSNDLPLTLGLLVDHSGSMKPHIENTRKAALGFFEKMLGSRDRAFFGGFSWQTTIVSPFVSDLGTLRAQVGAMPEPDGGTALYDAIITGLYRFRSVPGRKALVIVSDGADTVSRVDYAEMLRYVRVARVPLYFIGIGISGMDISASSKMKGLADETGGRALFVRDAKNLDKVYGDLEKELRTQYLVSYYTESTKKNQKYRTVEVKVKRDKVKVSTIRGFIP